MIIAFPSDNYILSSFPLIEGFCVISLSTGAVLVVRSSFHLTKGEVGEMAALLYLDPKVVWLSCGCLCL